MSNAIIFGRITRTSLATWIEANRPDLAITEVNGTKGFYRQDVGPASSFVGCGDTWRDVAARLEAIEIQGDEE